MCVCVCDRSSRRLRARSSVWTIRSPRPFHMRSYEHNHLDRCHHCALYDRIFGPPPPHPRYSLHNITPTPLLSDSTRSKRVHDQEARKAKRQRRLALQGDGLCQQGKLLNRQKPRGRLIAVKEKQRRRKKQGRKSTQ